MATAPTGSSDHIKLDKLCRTCLTKDETLHSLFDMYLETTLSYIITSITGVDVQLGDGLPLTICDQCKGKAILAYDFKNKCQETNVILHDILSNSKQEDINVEKPSVKYCRTETVVTIKNEVPNDDDDDDDNNDIFDSGYDFVNDIEKDFEQKDGKIDIEVFICNICHINYGSEETLREHIPKCIKEEHMVEEATFCPLCGLYFNDSSLLTKHVWSSHPELMGPKKRGRPKKLVTNAILNRLSENGFKVTPVLPKQYNCSLCREDFNTMSELTEHWKTHKDTTIYCCLFCKSMFLKKSSFNKHTCSNTKSCGSSTNEEKLQENGKEGDVNDIDLEDNKFYTCKLEELIQCTSDTEYVNAVQACFLCNALFTSFDDLIDHTDIRHPNVSRKCNVCLRVFTTIKAASRHRKLCKRVEGKYKCNTCGVKFDYEISLNKHILRYHEGQQVSVKFIDTQTKRSEKKFSCYNCNKRFSRQELLDKHSKQHIPNAKKYECPICGKQFFRADRLKSHVLIHQPEYSKELRSTSCLCLYCGRSFASSSNLIVHMRRHTGEKPYKCDFCDKGFPRSSDLQYHRRSHTGEKPCICEICEKAFSRGSKLARHMRVHTGQRPYKCTYCDKAFSQSNDLKLHVRRHTGDKPYVCEICGDRFIQGTALQNHRRTHSHFPPGKSSDQTVVPDLMNAKSIQITLQKKSIDAP